LQKPKIPKKCKLVLTMNKKIVKKAQEMFFRFGYSKVTLAEIATDMGISKKTIYNHFEGKEELLYAVMDLSRQEFEEQIEDIENNQNFEFREMVMEVLSVLGIWVSQIQTFIADLRRTQPNALNYMYNIRKDVILSYAMHILKKGKQLGLLNDNKESTMALFVFLAAAEKVTDEDYKKNLPSELTKNFPGNPSEIFKTILEIIYKGIKK